MDNIIGFGVLIFVTFWVLFRRISLMKRLKLLGRPFLLDATVTVAVIALYGGTGTGLLAGTMAGLLVSISISYYRKRYGFIRKDKYHIGRVNLIDEIENEILRKIGAERGRNSNTLHNLDP